MLCRTLVYRHKLPVVTSSIISAASVLKKTIPEPEWPDSRNRGDWIPGTGVAGFLIGSKYSCLFFCGLGTEVNSFSIRLGRSLHNRFGECRVWMNGLDNFVSGGFQITCNHSLGDHIGNIGTDHVAAEPFAVFLVEDDLDKSVGLSGANGFTVRLKREFANFNLVACFFGLLFGHADRG